jgi:hypothetical protein
VPITNWFYARVSTKKQDPKSQVNAARARGIPTKNIVVEVASGGRHDRPELARLLARLEPGDTLVTYKLDRLARSLHHLLTVVKDLEARGIAFETLDGINTKGSTGKLVLQIFGAVAEFEKNLLLERTMAGLEAARAEGRVGGRRRAMTPQQDRGRAPAHGVGRAESPRSCQAPRHLRALALAKPALGGRQGGAQGHAGGCVGYLGAAAAVNEPIRGVGIVLDKHFKAIVAACLVAIAAVLVLPAYLCP